MTCIYTPQQQERHRVRMATKTTRNVNEEGCWSIDCAHTGGPNGDDYPTVTMSIDGKRRGKTLARVILEMQGIDMTGLVPCHSCDNKWCCNPEHIKPGTYSQNLRESYDRQGRQHRRPNWDNALLVAVVCDRLRGMTYYELKAKYAIGVGHISGLMNRSLPRYAAIRAQAKEIVAAEAPEAA